VKIALCLPIHGSAKPGFVQSLARLIQFTMAAEIDGPDGRVRPELDTFMFSCANIAYSRRHLARLALRWGAEWLLWLDADQIFPPDTLLRLLMRGRAIVGANIRRRDAGAVLPTAATLKQGVMAPLLPGGEDIEEVLFIGFGVCLVHRQVFERIGQPFFHDTIDADGFGLVGEDVNFCNAARKAGFRVYVDHALSWHVGHVADVPLYFPKDQLGGPEGEA
jgi:hypothetical protein